MTGRRFPGTIAGTIALCVSLLARMALAAPVERPSAGAVCGSTNPLTLIGIDTTSGSTLFYAPPVGSGTPWIVELSGDGSRARVHPDLLKGRFGGSVGPGPVLAATPCGETCLQAVRWKGGSWEPVGEPLRAPTATTVTSTYDQTGTAWFLVQFPAKEDGSVRVEAFRLKGRDWESRGALTVTAVGQPASLPAPQRKDGVLVGTGLFSASGRPESWVTGVPSLPAARRGQLIALTGSSAAYLSADGVVYLSDDSGRKWRRSTWTPWGKPGKPGEPDSTVGIWRQGSDWWVDLPFGDHQGALRLAWFDRRDPAEEKILLTRLTQSGEWVLLDEAKSELSTRNEALPLSQIIVPRGATWILLSSCVSTGGKSALALRVFDGTSVSSAKLVPLE